MSYTLTGKLFELFDTIQRTDTFKVREFIIEKSEEFSGRNFTNYIKFQCTQDRTSIPDPFTTGDEITVHFNIKGSKWEKDGKVSYFNNLDAWKIESAGVSAPPQHDDQSLQATSSDSSIQDDNSEDDLPF